MPGDLFGALLPAPTVRTSDQADTRVIGTADFDLDGRVDMVLGQFDRGSLTARPVKILLNQGDGTFKQGYTGALKDMRAQNPLVEIADFNGDGRPDLLLFDKSVGPRFLGFVPGGEPVALMSAGEGFAPAAPLGDLYEAVPGRYPDWEAVREAIPDPASATSRTVHTKTLSTADIDGDGDLDVFVEGGGGWPLNKHHFLINDGEGGFTVAWNERLDSDGIKGDALDRFLGTELADLDGDGDADLVMGALRNGEAEQDDATPIIAFNDGRGFFPLEDVVRLPLPAFHDGYVANSVVDAADIDSDGDLDLVLTHDRRPLFPDDPAFHTGRYTQILINDGGRFTDETAARFPNVPAVTSKSSPHQPDGWNRWISPVDDFRMMTDLNGDGHADVIYHVSTPPNPSNPLVYLNDGDGVFDLVPSDDIAAALSGQVFLPTPFDVTDDGLPDIVSAVGWNTEFPTFVYMIPALRRWSTGPEFEDAAPMGAPGFNEAWYLRNAPGAARAVEKGRFENGLDHFLSVGREKGLPSFAEGTRVEGHRGRDKVDLRGGDETFLGLGGADVAKGRGGDDVLLGGGGRDRLSGGRGADELEGGGGADTLIGGGGADALAGGGGRDELRGGGGADLLAGGRGADVLRGGPGGDAFRFGARDGADLITDFRPGADRLEVAAGASAFEDLALRRVTDGLEVSWARTEVVLDGLRRRDLDEGDVLFA